MDRTRFNSSNYWEDRYASGGNSGAGSYNHLAEFKADILNGFFTRYKISRVVEYGCGDGNQLALLQIKSYIGYDVSPTVIEMNKQKFKNSKTKTFRLIDDETTDFEEADAVLSLDVIFHLTEDHVFEKYMRRLFSHPGAFFVIIYSTDTNRDRAIHVRDRKVTSYIHRQFPEWELFKSVNNPYAHIPHPNGSRCQFLFYRKRLVVT